MDERTSGGRRHDDRPAIPEVGGRNVTGAGRGSTMSKLIIREEITSLQLAGGAIGFTGKD